MKTNRISVRYIVWSSVILLAVIAVQFPKIARSDVNPDLTPGICLSFDDQSVDEWIEILDLLDEYSLRVTFFVSAVQTWDSDRLQKLKQLTAKGHEIGFHTSCHLDAVRFLKTHSIEEWTKKEIRPGMSVLEANGIHPVAFAPAFGISSKLIDRQVFREFDILRKVSESQRHIAAAGIDTLDDIYCIPGSQKCISALGIDNHLEVSLEELDAAFSRAASERTVISLYAHQPDNGHKKYQINIIYLEEILKLCKKHGLSGYTVSELTDCPYSNRNTI